MVRHGSAKPITGVRIPSAPPPRSSSQRVYCELLSVNNFYLRTRPEELGDEGFDICLIV